MLNFNKQIGKNFSSKAILLMILVFCFLFITIFILRDFTRQRQQMLIEEKFGVELSDFDDFHHESCEFGTGFLDEARGDVFRIKYNFYQLQMPPEDMEKVIDKLGLVEGDEEIWNLYLYQEENINCLLYTTTWELKDYEKIYFSNDRDVLGTPFPPLEKILILNENNLYLFEQVHYYS